MSTYNEDAPRVIRGGSHPNPNPTAEKQLTKSEQLQRSHRHLEEAVNRLESFIDRLSGSEHPKDADEKDVKWFFEEALHCTIEGQERQAEKIHELIHRLNEMLF